MGRNGGDRDILSKPFSASESVHGSTLGSKKLLKMVIGFVFALCIFTLVFNSNVAMHLSAMRGSLGYEHVSFLTDVGRFPYSTLLDKQAKGSEEPTSHFALQQGMIDHLLPWVLKAPEVPVNTRCGPPKLKTITKEECAKYPHGLTGKLLDKTKKVGVVTMVGFEADVLEIYLQEVYDVVDYVFLIESTIIHGPSPLRKPLIWEELRRQPRFQRFSRYPSKIVYLVNGDEGIPPSGGTFGAEQYQRKLRYEKVMAWNERTKAFKVGDLIGFGDTDGIIRRENIHLLKHCEAKEEEIDIGIWFSFGELDRAFKPDWPTGGDKHRWSLGMFTFHSMTDEKLSGKMDRIPEHLHGNNLVMGFPDNRLGMSKAYLLGGMHATHYPYLPYILMKHFTASEYYGDKGSVVRLAEMVREHSQKSDELAKWQEEAVNSWYWGIDKVEGLGKQRFMPARDLKKEDPALFYIPWFVECNPRRYYSGTSRPDPRLL
eukprot:Nk52_evm24s2496 gene=Nk52_evmTU24s2496